MGIDIFRRKPGFDTETLKCIGVDAKNCTKLGVTRQTGKRFGHNEVLPVKHATRHRMMKLNSTGGGTKTVTTTKKAGIDHDNETGKIPEDKLVF